MPIRNLLFALMLMGPIVILALPGCAVCKGSDTYEQCRTKQRNHNQPHVQRAGAFLSARRA